MRISQIWWQGSKQSSISLNQSCTVYIPKPNGEKIPLGLPTVENNIIRMAIKKILEAIFEQDFMDTSYGFRPNRRCHDALTELDWITMNAPVNFVVDMDISKFDTVEHKRLMECLRQRIVDPTLLQSVGRFLKSGIMEEGIYFDGSRCTAGWRIKPRTRQCIPSLCTGLVV